MPANATRLEGEFAEAIIVADVNDLLFGIVAKDFVTVSPFVYLEPFAALLFLIVNAEFQGAADSGEPAKFENILDALVRRRNGPAQCQ